MQHADRREDNLSRSEFLASHAELASDIKQILIYQRETNGKVAVAFERLGVLEERTATLKDAPARAYSLIGMGIAVITFLFAIFRGTAAAR